jgi:hypothetical protein
MGYRRFTASLLILAFASTILPTQSFAQPSPQNKMAPVKGKPATKPAPKPGIKPPPKPGNGSKPPPKPGNGSKPPPKPGNPGIKPPPKPGNPGIKPPPKPGNPGIKPPPKPNPGIKPPPRPGPGKPWHPSKPPYPGYHFPPRPPSGYRPPRYPPYTGYRPIYPPPPPPIIRPGAWYWNHGSAWRPAPNYWGGGFWGTFAIGTLAAVIIGAITQPQYATYRVAGGSPGAQLLNSYGLQQVPCYPNAVVIHGPQDTIVCAEPNGTVAPGDYTVDESTLTLINYQEY